MQTGRAKTRTLVAWNYELGKGFMVMEQCEEFVGVQLGLFWTLVVVLHITMHMCILYRTL